jgi:hypothetical protein
MKMATKPVIEETIAKDGTTIIRFNPLPTMWAFAIAKSKMPEASIEDIATEAGISAKTFYEWRKKYSRHFLEWLEDAVDSQHFGKEAALLEQIGMMQAMQPGNYQYWRDMARKHGVIADEVKSQNITINTDFSIISLGGDIEEKRRRLLSQVFGLANGGGTPLAGTPALEHQGSHSGAGNRASSVSERPVEVLDPLGADRGHSEQGISLPTVPEQDPPSSADPRLDEGAVLIGAEKSSN